MNRGEQEDEQKWRGKTSWHCVYPITKIHETEQSRLRWETYGAGQLGPLEQRGELSSIVFNDREKTVASRRLDSVYFYKIYGVVRYINTN